MAYVSVRERLEALEERLSPYASKVRFSKGRLLQEEPSALRTEFQRDRDRILHTNAFRRLKHKTQVFIAPLGDHYATRLTHTLEVAQISRTITRALNLNEDLVEAISLGHDIGHTPFGHVGEAALNELAPGGFKHNYQSLRIVEVLEKGGQGLNLTWEVRHGIVNHSKPQGDFLGENMAQNLTLEAQICRLSDAIAYLNHDIGDAIRGNLLEENRLPTSVQRTLGTRHSQRIDIMVTDVVEASWECTGANWRASTTPSIKMSPSVRQALNTLRGFMFEQVYLPSSNSMQSQRGREILIFLFTYFSTHPEEVPEEYQQRQESATRIAVDYISGMTDQFAVRLAEELYPGISKGAFANVI